MVAGSEDGVLLGMLTRRCDSAPMRSCQRPDEGVRPWSDDLPDKGDSAGRSTTRRRARLDAALIAHPDLGGR